MNFITDTILRGRWWVPNEKEEETKEVYGELIYKKLEGITLILEGSFFNTESIFKALHNITLPVVHGLVKEGEFVTLLNLWGNEAGRETWIYTHFNVDYALVNKKGYFALSEMGISTINFCTNSFSSFFDGYAKFIQTTHSKPTELQFTYIEKPPVEIIENKELNAYFFFYYGYKGLSEDEFTFNEKIFFNVEFKSQISFTNAVEKIRYYRDFFTFFSFPVVSFEIVNVFTKDEEERLIEFKLLFKEQAKEIGRRIPPYEMLLSYEEATHNFNQMFERWIGNEEQNKSVLALYMQLAYLKFPSEIQSFLNIVFAIETLHNTYFDYKVLSIEKLKEFKSQKKSALENCFSEEFHQKIIECLGHFSNPSFSNRLNDMIVKSKSLVKEYIYDIDDFIKKVNKQRNFLAHNHGEIEKSVIGKDQYPYFIGVLKMIFECSFLRILGFEEEQISKMIKRNYNYDKQKGKVAEMKLL